MDCICLGHAPRLSGAHPKAWWASQKSESTTTRSWCVLASSADMSRPVFTSTSIHKRKPMNFASFTEPTKPTLAKKMSTST